MKYGIAYTSAGGPNEAIVGWHKDKSTGKIQLWDDRAEALEANDMDGWRGYVRECLGVFVVSHTNKWGKDKGHTKEYVLAVHETSTLVVVLNTTDNSVWSCHSRKDCWEKELREGLDAYGCVRVY